MSTAEILKAIDDTPARRKGTLMAKLAQRLEDFYDIQKAEAALNEGEWTSFADLEKELDAKRTKASRNK
jgi:hypothetical protein